MQNQALPAVLVVEDEFLIRMDALDMVCNASLKIYKASSADQAILLMDQHMDIGILFTDTDIPGSIEGLKLAAYVLDRWPPFVIIGSSRRYRGRLSHRRSQRQALWASIT